MTVITCKIPRRLNAQLEAAAREQRISKSEVVRQLLEQGFNGKGKTSAPSAYDLTKHLCGSLRGGPRDLSTNPKHLEGFGE